MDKIIITRSMHPFVATSMIHVNASVRSVGSETSANARYLMLQPAARIFYKFQDMFY